MPALGGFASLDISPPTMEKVGEHIRSTQDKLSLTFSLEKVVFVIFSSIKCLQKNMMKNLFPTHLSGSKNPRLIFDRDVAASRYFVFGVKIFVRMGPD